MSDLLLLSEEQMRRIEPYFALLHGVPRVDAVYIQWDHLPHPQWIALARRAEGLWPAQNDL